MNITTKLITDIVECMIADSRNDLTWGDAPVAHKAVAFALDQANKLVEATPIYQVSAKQTDRDVNLGFFTGKTHDIASYCDDRKGYGLVIEEVRPTAIKSGYKAHKDNIVAKRDRLQAELDALNARLESGDIS